MINFDKIDIPALDFIIDKLVEHSFIITVKDLKKANFINLKIDGYETLTQELDEEKEFERLLSIIDLYNCAECHFREFLGEAPFVKSSPRTLQFKKQGGFKKAYEDLIESKEHSLIIKNKERNDAKLSKWKVKTFWWFFGLAIFGGLYSIYDFTERLTKSENDQLKQETKEQKESGLSKSHTLILNQKNLDSLSNSKILSDSLIIN